MGKIAFQWNCRGLRSNREDIELLIHENNPAVICLQETKLSSTQNMRHTFKYHSTYYHNNSDSSDGGVGIIVQNSCPHSLLDLNTDLEVIAVHVTLGDKSYIFGSIYVSPSVTVTELQFNNLIKQFKHPYLLLGDFNAHSPLWGTQYQNSSIQWGNCSQNNTGKVIEKIIDNHDLILLNNSVILSKICCSNFLINFLKILSLLTTSKILSLQVSIYNNFSKNTFGDCI